ncbi:MAG: lipoprotein signal peptidase, partial [Hyphomicrobiales bacterium]|nr:lipoprotein signal peptidase [Hyphomicrobiales bacterium]
MQGEAVQGKPGGIKVYRWLALTLLALILDQISKQLIMQQMALHQSIEVMPYFNLYYVHNYGAAFSFLSDQSGWQRWFFSVTTTLISLGIVFWLSRLRASQKLLIIALALVLGGALGNLYDRLVYGYVIDFIDWYVGDYHWPAFNIADASIFLGAV